MKQSSIRIRLDSKGQKKVFRRKDNRFLGVIIDDLFRINDKNKLLTRNNLADIISEIKNIRNKYEVKQLGGHIVGNVAKWMIDYLAEITNSQIYVVTDIVQKVVFVRVIVALKEEDDLPLFCLEYKKDMPVEVKVDFYDAIPTKTINKVFEGILLINELIQTETLRSYIPACSLLNA